MIDNEFPLPEKSKWSNEAILMNRRKRMARRLFKRSPLFACQEISERFGITYTHDDFINDQYLKNGTTQGKRKVGQRKPNGKKRLASILQKQIKDQLSKTQTNEINGLIRRFYALQSSICQPWKVQLVYGDLHLVYTISNRHKHERIADFMAKGMELLKAGKEEEIDRMHRKLTEHMAY